MVQLAWEGLWDWEQKTSVFWQCPEPATRKPQGTEGLPEISAASLGSADALWFVSKFFLNWGGRGGEMGDLSSSMLLNFTSLPKLSCVIIGYVIWGKSLNFSGPQE